MAAQVDIQTDVSVAEEVEGLLVRAVEATLAQQGYTAVATLSILLTDDAHIQQLNRDFLGLDKPTDVLSFPAGDAMPGMAMPDVAMSTMVGANIYLGDIAVSVPYAERQAAHAGHRAEAELQLLVVHGTLHLLGHDHAEPQEKARMWAAQTAVLAQLGLDDITPTEA